MSTIGAFTKHDGCLNGRLRTLAFNVKVKIVPISKDNSKGPDDRIFARGSLFHKNTSSSALGNGASVFSSGGVRWHFDWSPRAI